MGVFESGWSRETVKTVASALSLRCTSMNGGVNEKANGQETRTWSDFPVRGNVQLNPPRTNRVSGGVRQLLRTGKSAFRALLQKALASSSDGLKRTPPRNESETTHLETLPQKPPAVFCRESARFQIKALVLGSTGFASSSTEPENLRQELRSVSQQHCSDIAEQA